MRMLTDASPRRARLHDPARLIAVAKALPRSLDTVAMHGLQTFVDDLADTLPGATVAVNLIWADDLFVLAAHGMPDWIMKVGGMPIDWAACAHVVEHDEPLLITDTHDDPDHAHNPVVTVCGVRSYIGVPLRDADHQVIGTLVAFHKTPSAFAETDLHALTAAAPQALALLPTAAK